MDKQDVEKRALYSTALFGKQIKKISKSHALKATANAAFKFGLSFLLARGVIFGGYAPFGVAFVAAQNSRDAIFAVLGAILGYASAILTENGLKYIAITILCFAVRMVFAKTDIVRKSFFMPGVTFITFLCIGFVFVAEAGYTYEGVMLFLCETLLATAAAYFYGLGLYGASALASDEKSSKTMRFSGYLALFTTTLIAVQGASLFGVISVSRMLATLTILLIGYVAGAAPGAIAAIVIGTAMDMGGGQGAFFASTYALSVLVAALLSKNKRILFALFYVIGNAAFSVWGLEDVRYIPGLYECFVASVIFILAPESMFLSFKDAAETFPDASGGDYAKYVKDYVFRKLNDTASAFYELYLSMIYRLSDTKTKNEEDITHIFQTAAERVCKKCILHTSCWERDFISTQNALNDATQTIVKRGRAEAFDFPTHFAARCISFAKFLTAVNDGLALLVQRRQYRAKIKENKELIREQYESLSGILQDVASDVQSAVSHEPEYERKVVAFISKFWPVRRVAVFSDPARRLNIEVEGPDLSQLLSEEEAFRDGVFALIAKSFGVPEQVVSSAGWKLRFLESVTYRAVIGVGTRKKQGEHISGDSGTYFKNDDGKIFMILSDGMGSGREAAFGSAMAVRLIEKFLRAGISPAQTIKTIYPALKVKSDERGYVTIDIVSVDLFSGECEILKYGSAPTYIRNDGRVLRVMAHGLPPGLDPGGDVAADLSRVKIREGSIIVVQSDGVSDGTDDTFLKEMLLAPDAGGVKDIAAQIITAAAARRTGSPDDMSVMVMRVLGPK